MTFTDNDLKRLKEWLTGEVKHSSQNPKNLNGLIARLEAAEGDRDWLRKRVKELEDKICSLVDELRKAAGL